MKVKDIKKIEMMSSKRKLKTEDQETKKIKVELYCVLCQRYGHVLSEECVASAICFNCGIKGHIRRDCKEERCEIKSEIKFEEVKEESSNSENEYVEEEIRKDTITPLNMSKEYIEEDVDDKKNIKVEEYCILCQMHCHFFSEACVSNAVCFACGVKGHVRRDCKVEKCELKHAKLEIKNEIAKYEEEYVEVDINKSELKTELNLVCNSDLTEVKEKSVTSVSTREENNGTKFSLNPPDGQTEVILKDDIDITKVGKNCGQTHSLKECTVNLFKVNLTQIEEATSKSNREAKYETKYKPHLTRHIKAVHRDISYDCKKCNYKAKYKIALANHVQAKHKGINYICKQCNNKFTRKASLTEHIQVQHEGITFSCQKCNYKAKYKCNISQHMKAEHDGITHDCKKCNYKAKYKFALTSHVQAKHMGVRYTCKKCNYKSKYKRHISLHMKAEHEGITYDCKKCNYKAKYNFALTNHVQAEHKGVRYACKKCNYKTKYKTNLSIHMKAEHEGVRHDCQKCNFQSKIKGNLIKHMKAKHVGVSYACKKCSFKTKCPRNLSKHMKTVH